MMKIEQDFVNSNPEKKAWISTPPTSSNKENMSHDEKKVPVPGPFTRVPKFVGTFITF
jgi:hypothetical protein